MTKLNTIKLGRSRYKDEFYDYDRYRKSNRTHRDDGPAIIRYYDSTKTKILVEEYYINGQIHREDGPANIRYYDSGTIYSYSIHGQWIHERDWLHRQLNKLLKQHDMYIKKNKIYNVINDEVIVEFEEDKLKEVIEELLC